MGTLIKKVTPDSSYLWLKTSKNEICFSGFPKKAYQGSLISEGAIENLTKIIFSLTPYSYYSAHANAVSGNSMCYIQMGCVWGDDALSNVRSGLFKATRPWK